MLIYILYYSDAEHHGASPEAVQIPEVSCFHSLALINLLNGEGLVSGCYVRDHAQKYYDEKETNMSHDQHEQHICKQIKVST